MVMRKVAVAAESQEHVEVPVLPQPTLERLQMHDMWMGVDSCDDFVRRTAT